MKIMLFLLLVLTPLSVFSQKYTGTIERIVRNGETIVIDGTSYQFNLATKTFINGQRAGDILLLEPGMPVKYSVQERNNGSRFLTEVHFLLPEDELRSLTEH